MRRLYWVNAALLAAHEVDAAVWREWLLLHLPGGPGGFVLLHVLAFVVLLWGYDAVVDERRTAVAWTTALGVVGIAAAGGHGALLWLGAEPFRSWSTIAVLAAIGLVSLLQLAAARFEFRVRQRSAGRGNRVFLEIN